MRAPLLCLLLSASLLSSPVYAQTANERTAARSAAESGLQAFDEGDYSRALELLQRAESVVHAPTHLLYIARSEVALGQLVEARETYLTLVNESLKSSSEAFLAAQVSGREELVALEPRIPRATISVEGAKGPDVKVTIDGQPVLAISLGVPTPVNPGHHVVAATAPGGLSAQAELTLEERASESVALTLQATEENASSEPAPSEVDSGTYRPLPTAVYVGLATTGLLAAGATVTGILTLSKNKTYDELNDGDNFDEAESARKSVKTLGLTSDILWGTAAVSAAVTAYFYFTRPEQPRSSTALQFTPLVGPNVAALSVSGGF